MSTALRRPMTIDEFLAWNERQERSFKFDGFAPVAIGDVTQAHAVIQANLAIAIGGRLRAKGGRCRSLGAELRVETALGTIRFPDGLITCTLIDPRRRGGAEPIVLFEILSDSTGATDRVLKAREYRATASVGRYVMLEQTHIAATVLTREPDGRWTSAELLPGDTLDLPEAGLEPIPIEELFAELTFGEADA